MSVLLTVLLGCSFICSLCAQAGDPATTNTAGSLVLTNGFGDLNNDTKVSVLDIVLLTHQIRGTRPLPPAMIPRADLDQDGQATSADRTILAAMILEIQNKADEDFDSDDQPNAEEVRLGLNPFQPDVDHDGWLDGVELAEGTDPRSPNSHPSWTFLARPLLAIDLPSPQAAGIGGSPVFLAHPPVQVDLSSPETAGIGGSPVTLARPPVGLLLTSPETEGIGGRPVFLAQPRVQVDLSSPETAGIGGSPVTLARPPVGLLLTSPETEGIGGRPVFLAQPPVSVNLPSD